MIKAAANNVNPPTSQKTKSASTANPTVRPAQHRAALNANKSLPSNKTNVCLVPQTARNVQPPKYAHNVSMTNFNSTMDNARSSLE